MEKGWIKLHRKLLSNPVVMKDAEHLAIWTWLLLNVTHDGSDVLFRGKKMRLKPGQMTVGRRQISEELRVSEMKVQRVLSCLESEQQIEQQKSNRCRLITIRKWKDYQEHEQQIEQQMNNHRTTDEQQMNTKQEWKNERMEETLPAVGTAGDEETQVNEIFSVFYETINPQINFGRKPWRAATLKLIKRYGFDVILKLTKYACSIQGQEFAPTITNPFELHEKLPSLQIFIKRQSEPKKGAIQTL